ncbi:uncharacterized protein LOC122135564 [Cyprinus carpio]|uniref:Uncharacterized protein LOC122135564 n=1 Tax=Cyprinus carpio TaxID=7962 RepID=A0A9Q9ZS78_CYPCA|nr:uncharacterized protein LOC122135564 [Cyprinus carpio]
MRHRRFLRFALEGTAYQYSVLPFGPRPRPPHIFKVCGRSAFSPWIEQNVHLELSGRLADFSPLKRCANQSGGNTASPFGYAGLRVNMQKSVFFTEPDYNISGNPGRSVSLKGISEASGTDGGGFFRVPSGSAAYAAATVLAEYSSSAEGMVFGPQAHMVTHSCVSTLRPWSSTDMFNPGVPLGIVTQRTGSRRTGQLQAGEQCAWRRTCLRPVVGVTEKTDELQSDYLLDLYSHVKNYETQTGRSFLPALQSVFQSPAVWIIDLSQRKIPILLEVLKLQSKKNPVELRGCSEEESEMMSFLQCLPYISQLRFSNLSEIVQNRFLLGLFNYAAEIKTQTGEQMLKLLSSVCTYSSFPYEWTDIKQSDFLLDFYSHVKNYETQTGRSFLPALQSVFQSPDVWIIDLSQRKSFVLLEVLEFQSKKKPVKLRGCSEEESEVMSFPSVSVLHLTAEIQ